MAQDKSCGGSNDDEKRGRIVERYTYDEEANGYCSKRLLGGFMFLLHAASMSRLFHQNMTLRYLRVLVTAMLR
jgi:hypothetical protein